MSAADQLTQRFSVAPLRPATGPVVGVITPRRVIALFILAGTEGLLLWLLYAVAIVPTFGYQRFSYQNPGVASLVVALTIAALPSLTLPATVRRPSFGVLWVLYVVVIIPSAVIPHLIPLGTTADHFRWELLLVGSFLLATAIIRVPTVSTVRVHVLRRHAVGVLVVAYTVVALYLLVKLGVSLRPVGFADVYAVRLRARTVLETDVALAYLVPWFQNVICPCLLVAGWTTRRWLLVAMGLAGEVYIYQAFGNRQALLGVLFIAGFLIVVRQLSLRHVAHFILATACILLGLVLIVHISTDAVVPTSIIGLRTFAIPGILSANYYDFFSAHPIVLLRDGLLGHFARSPYSLSTSNLISDVYYGLPSSTSNAHVWADGFANFGLLAFLLVPVLLGLVLWLIDAATANVPVAVVLAGLSFLIISWGNVGLTTSLVTSGTGLMLVLLLLTGGAVLSPRT